MKTMNAVTASILMWHYYNRQHYCKDTDHGASPSVESGYSDLADNSLLDRSPASDDNLWPNAAITEKGRVLVDRWLATPLPVQVVTWEFPEVS